MTQHFLCRKFFFTWNKEKCHFLRQNTPLTGKSKDMQIEVGDSTFTGFVKGIESKSEALSFQKSLQNSHSTAAHIPICWMILNPESKINNLNEIESCGYLEDGEPGQSVGPYILEELKTWKQATVSKYCSKRDCNIKVGVRFGLVVGIVRYFGNKLLGVTCGRLPQCYKSICKFTLHRFFNENKPLVQEFLYHPSIENGDPKSKSIYGLCAGDTELILNILPFKIKQEEVLNNMLKELKFDAFKGSLNENLPRLQNLQANISAEGAIPIYRYPGNYTGDEWETFSFQQSPTSLIIKDSVEDALLPLHEQSMNHCVTNYYRDGKDFIDHHSDKDLDLNKNGVIVSVSLGGERVMELRRRAEPKDITRILLPHGSMLMIGPKTNKQFTHSIIRKPDFSVPRISLTFRHVTTYLDRSTGMYFGQGVKLNSMQEVHNTRFRDNFIFFLGFCSVLGISANKDITNEQIGMLTTMLISNILLIFSFSSYRFVLRSIRTHKEEKQARAFFSKSSASGTKY